VSNYNHLTIPQQKAVSYLVGTSFTVKQIAEIIGVSEHTLSGWKRDPIFSAAVQEKLSEAVSKTQESYQERINPILDGLFNELQSRILSEQGITIQTDKLAKIIVDLMKTLGTAQKPEEPDPEAKDQEFTKRLIERMKYSRTGERYQKRKAQIEHEKRSKHK
jgi:transposase